jgi:Uma2 family endonuclease
VTVAAGIKPGEPIVGKPPAIAVEVFSPDDRAGDLEEQIADDLAFGVRYVPVVNPESHRACVHTPRGGREVKDGMLRTESTK